MNIELRSEGIGYLLIKTTDSNHVFKRYFNPIKELIITGAMQLWVSDITYIKTFQDVIITDPIPEKLLLILSTSNSRNSWLLKSNI